ncbi:MULTISPECIES: hypothetical protein [Catenuloplanes]|uniref:Uncharacterized protein n=1 Tax=Catenuloplanes niger TaxID=587534 RepID=A0AAE4CXP6_9ACTN|nr:hypothetical protein [Catenuloplanes niger]MDR7325049.1 hypothetical protein [Catenuloplanes niger]
MINADDPMQWQTDKLSALRLGRRLVTEVSSSGQGRRAFVDIRPIRADADHVASREGWVRPDRDRTFKVEHWDYDADQLDGFDYDVGAALVRAATVTGEAELAAILQAWDLLPGQFRHPWDTDDPR